MRPRFISLTLALILLLSACAQTTPTAEQLAVWKNEIYETELAFSNMSETTGTKEAFQAFADDEVVIRRGGKLIKGIDSLRIFYENSTSTATLSWEPDFVDVSNSGDLGYTYGQAKFTRMDSLRNPQVNTGTFHTVWKRQPDGTWKFVYD